jgi:F0F1-type ATP synthase assembly protein I
MLQLLAPINRIKERGNELTARLADRSSEVRDHAREIAERSAPRVTGKTMFTLVSLVSGVLGGALAGALFNRVWRTVSDTDEVPVPTALDRNVREVLIAGVLQGAVFGLVKAALGRITATGYRRFTGSDPTH